MNLSVEQLHYRVGRQVILEDITFHVASGTVMSIVGPNGAGKSTLLRSIGQLVAHRGRVLIDGTPLSDLPPGRRTEGIGYVPQSFSAVFPFTVFDFVLFGRRSCMGWKPRSTDLRTVSETLEMLGITHLALRQVNRLSGGEKQMVLIARALARKPGILLLDEPTSSLDIRHQLDILRLVAELSTDFDMAVLMAIHDLNLALSFSQKMVMISNGRIHDAGAPTEVVTQDNIRTVYGVDSYIPENPPVPFMVPLPLNGK